MHPVANLHGNTDYERLNYIRLLTIFNQVVPAGGVNIIPAATPIVLPTDCLIRVTVSENTGAVFSLALTRAGVQTVMAYNAGAVLVANGLYMFDFNARTGDIINFQFGVATTINLLNIDLTRVTGP